MKNRLFLPLLLLLAGSTGGCITEYEPPLSGSEVEGLLVVEGIISDGLTQITLSRSVRISSLENPSLSRVTGARVWVESEADERYQASAEAVDGEYIVPIDALDPETRYRLRISLDGQEFESEYRAPQRAASIEQVDFHLKSPEGPLQVRLDVRGQDDRSPYYLWSYEEVWEVQAYQMATHYLGYPGNYEQYYSMGEAGILFSSYLNAVRPYPDLLSPFYYGWKYGGSRSLLLGSSERMIENALYDHVLYEIETDDDRLSVLYYTKLRQYTLGEEAYFYLNNLKKNTDDAGSIFSPVPSEMRGNIVCSTDPDIPVIGYVEVSEATEKEIFLPRSQAPYQRPPHFCDFQEKTYEAIGIVVNELGGVVGFGQSFLTYVQSYFDGAPDPFIWTSNVCIDCRLQGGTKNRPAFWPNNHY